MRAKIVIAAVFLGMTLFAPSINATENSNNSSENNVSNVSNNSNANKSTVTNSSSISDSTSTSSSSTTSQVSSSASSTSASSSSTLVKTRSLAAVADNYDWINSQSNVVSLNSVFSSSVGNLPGPDAAGKVLIISNTIGQEGAIWSKETLDLSKNFNLSAYMYFGNRGGQAADGLTFTLQGTGATAKGLGGNGLGIYGTGVKGLSLEFDTYYNGDNADSDLGSGYGQSNNHIAFVDPNFDPTAKSYYFQGNDIKAPGSNHQATQRVNYLSDGQWKKLTVDYTASNRKLSYVLSTTGGTQIAAASTSVPNNLSNVYWGFTGSSGAEWAKNAIAFTKLPDTNVELSTAFQNSSGTPISTIQQGETVKYVINQNLVGSWAQLGKLTLDFSKFDGALKLSDSDIAKYGDLKNGKLTINQSDELKTGGTTTKNLTLTFTAAKTVSATAAQANLQAIVYSGTNTSGQQKVSTEKNDTATLEITIPPLTLSVADNDFGTYQLGKSDYQRAWTKANRIKVTDGSTSSQKWSLNMIVTSSNFGKFLRYGTTPAIKNYATTITGQGTQIISNSWDTSNGLNLDFAGVSQTGSYQAQLNWNLTAGGVNP